MFVKVPDLLVGHTASEHVMLSIIIQHQFTTKLIS